MENSLARTYVQHKGKWFYVSTINRESSAALAYGRMYAETIAWEWDMGAQKRGNIVGQYAGCGGSIRRHLEAVECLSRHGKMLEDTEE